jgi:hypothetical protein
VGLFELFELCAEAAQPPAEDGSSRAAPPRGFEAADFEQLKAQLFWPSLVSAVLVCLGLLQGFAAS